MNTVTFREYSGNDTPAFIRLLGMIWGYEGYSDDPVVRKHLIKLDAYASLYSKAYAEVALKDGKLAGVLFARPKGHRRRLFQWGYAWAFTRHYLKLLVHSKGSRRSLKNLRKTLRAYSSLTKGKRKDLRNEVTLFMVHPDYRGMGIGVALMRHYESFLLEKGEHTYHLFTDDTCSYGFYDHHGFQKKATTVINEALKDGESELTVMLYTKEISP
ncbi:MAG: GNAT family N-acetyltransferase [Bacillota bacterium]